MLKNSPRGGVALLKASFALDKVKTDSSEQVGIDILKFARATHSKTAINCVRPWFCFQPMGFPRSDIKSDLGYHAVTGEFISMTKAGILDPAKVTKSALTNAVSVGTMILTTDVLIADIPEKKPATPDMSGMGGMDMGM